MPQATRDIKRRIKSVKNTNKITKAMELVAASKMRKADDKVLDSRAYSDLAWESVLRLVKKVDTNDHRFFQEAKKVENVAIVLISTNRGLCGSFNTSLVKKLKDSIKLHHPNLINTDIITYGTKGRDEARKKKLNLIADFEKEDITKNSLETRPISSLVIKEFENSKYDKVFVAYTDFDSTLVQLPHIKQILPIIPEIDERLGHIAHEDNKGTFGINDVSEFVWEESREKVLNAFLPRIIELEIYQTVLESEASEHSARMFAMRNASDAAAEMIDNLTLIYNQARQAGITAEIAEISAGSAALE